MKVMTFLCALACATAYAAPVAIILDDRLPQTDPVAVKALAEAVARGGYQVRHATVDQFNEPDADLLVLPNAGSAPLATIPTVLRHLEGGGHVLACGLPAWQSRVMRTNGVWMTALERKQLLDRTRPVRLIADFRTEEPARWRRGSNTDNPPSTARAEEGAMHVVVPALSGWDTYSRDFDAPFPDKHTITCFRAKAGPRTRQLIAEWQETDGSRWIATVDVDQTWRSFALPPEAFVAWQPPAGRGGRNDRLNVRNARRFAIGVAYSHIPDAGGRQEYWFADLGTAPDPLGPVDDTAEIPHIESLSPGYQFFPIHGKAVLSRPPGPLPASTMPIEPPARLMGIVPRPDATGFDKDRPWIRRVLLRAHEGRDYRGDIATLTIPMRAGKPSGAVVAFTPSEPRFYVQPAISAQIEGIARMLRRGLFIAEGGAGYYTTFADQPLNVGTRIVRTAGAGNGPASVHLAVEKLDGRKTLFQWRWPITFDANPATFSRIIDAGQLDPGEYRLITDLYEDQQIIERVEHDLHILGPRSRPRFVTVADGRFLLDGRRWKPHGVNYMPSSGVGLVHHGNFEYWLGAAAYDPAIIERDISRCAAMNMNAISVFLYHRDLQARNLLDLLRLCDKHNLKVNLSLRPGTPLDFKWNQVREMIQTLRLADSDTIFAYDLAWEPSHFDYNHQKRYAKQWTRWVAARHGSIERAEKSWGIAAPRDGDGLDVPPASMWTEDGPWRRMVADYRLFLDDYLAGPYAEARRLVRSIDPNHAVSFRMQHAGDPTINMSRLLPYDPWGLRNAVDIWEPEAYGRIGDWERVKPGHFTAAYMRLCDPSKPVMWSEMGVSVWDGRAQAPTADRLAFAAQYYRDFYRMMIESDADGVFFWWYPGGYRVNEQSDYGIINEDGTDRPVTAVIREHGPRFVAYARPPMETAGIEIDRDADARGLYGVYQAAGQAYWQAVESGKWPVLRWKRLPGQRE